MRCGLAQTANYGNWTKAQILDEHWFFAAVAFSVILPAVLGNPDRGVVRRVLGHRWMLWLGMISYGVYLWQASWLLELKRLGLRPGPMSVTLEWLVFGIDGALLLGAGSYYLIERPALRLGSLVGHARARRAPVPAES